MISFNRFLVTFNRNKLTSFVFLLIRLSVNMNAYDGVVVFFRFEVYQCLKEKSELQLNLQNARFLESVLRTRAQMRFGPK